VLLLGRCRSKAHLPPSAGWLASWHDPTVGADGAHRCSLQATTCMAVYDTNNHTRASWCVKTPYMDACVDPGMLTLKCSPGRRIEGSGIQSRATPSRCSIHVWLWLHFRRSYLCHSLALPTSTRDDPWQVCAAYADDSLQRAEAPKRPPPPHTPMHSTKLCTTVTLCVSATSLVVVSHFAMANAHSTDASQLQPQPQLNLPVV
jgi:hypothetical protein